MGDVAGYMRRARVAARVTLRELAAALGESAVVVGYMERGEAPWPTSHVAVAISLFAERDSREEGYVAPGGGVGPLRTLPGRFDSHHATPEERHAERLARLFHETYERLAPEYGYKTREASAVPWEQVPERNRALMVATCAELLEVLPQWLAMEVLSGG